MEERPTQLEPAPTEQLSRREALPYRGPRSAVRRTGSIARRWVRDTFSRDQLLGSLRSLLWVAPLTVLIWVYAEREQQTTANVDFQIQVNSPDPNQTVEIDGSTTRGATVRFVAGELKGPKARVEEMRERMQRASDKDAVSIPVDPRLGPGTHLVDIRSLVAQDPRFAAGGISVGEIKPSQIKINVDRLREVDVPVKVSRADAGRLKDPVFEPATVKVKAPVSQPDGGTPQAEADLTEILKTPGPRTGVAVRVRVTGIDGRNVTVEPATVKVTAEVKPGDDSYTIPAVPLYVTAPGDFLKKDVYVEYPATLGNVTVVGPREQIDALRAGNLPQDLRARFDVRMDDPIGQPRRRRVKYELPAGLSVSEQQATVEVDFQILARDPADSGL
jgi:hypothetical protein